MSRRRPGSVVGATRGTYGSPSRRSSSTSSPAWSRGRSGTMAPASPPATSKARAIRVAPLAPAPPSGGLAVAPTPSSGIEVAEAGDDLREILVSAAAEADEVVAGYRLLGALGGVRQEPGDGVSRLE